MTRRATGWSMATDRTGVDEPATIDATVIAEYLERQGKPGMASFVSRLGESLARSIAERQRLVAKLNELDPPQAHVHYGPRRTGD